MVNITGTYSTTKTQEYVDFYIHLGVPKGEAEKLLGTHWTMKHWMEGNALGGHLTCQELPQFNSIDLTVIGQSKQVEHPIFAGKLLLERKSDELFKTTIDTKNFGQIAFTEKFTEDGVHQTFEGKGKSVELFWARQVQVEGSYKYESGENVEKFFKTTGFVVFLETLYNYRLYLHMKNDMVNMVELFAHVGYVYNSFKPDVETHFRIPGDKNDGEGSHRGIMTCVGPNKFLLVVRSPKGEVEEWKMTFRDAGLFLDARNLKHGVSTKLFLKRITELSGTFKPITFVGFENFLTTLGISGDKTHDLLDTKLILTDKGSGIYRQQYVGGRFNIDVSFKLDDEFRYHDPIFNESVKAMVTLQDKTLASTFQTSKGIVKVSLNFSDNFLVKSVSHPGTGTSCKVIMERICL